ncbi:unnamed protein product [Spirodela intermedia]|uniref:Uncharacterized protein n=1 Tax=Spirodela intermedia TaxID=51605 RepID=A0ABN7EAC3_SPIIN|nr:unnamed protein product [Spirodela intermedia]
MAASSRAAMRRPATVVVSGGSGTSQAAAKGSSGLAWADRGTCAPSPSTSLMASQLHVGRMLGSFILRSAQQEEALHHIWYALKKEIP